MTRGLATNLFNAAPNLGRAQTLRAAMTRHLHNDLRKNIEIATKKLPMLGNAAGRVADQLDQSRRFSSHLFAAQWMLRSALTRQHVADVAAALNSILTIADDQNQYSVGHRIEPMRGDDADRGALDYLLSKRGPRGEHGELPEIAPLTRPEFSAMSAAVEDSIEMMRSAVPEIHREFSEIVTTIRLVHTRNCGNLSGPRSFGLMHLRYPTDPAQQLHPAFYYYEPLIHEMSHMMLNAIMLHDPLVLNDHTATFTHPLRHDSRPMTGIYHGAFVLARVTSACRALASQQPNEYIQKMAETSANHFATAIEMITEYGELSEAGHAVIASCEELVAASS